MLSRYLSLLTIVIAILCIHSAYGQRNALVLRNERQGGRSHRYGTSSSHGYRGNSINGNSSSGSSSLNRQTYGNFRGGGPGAGK